MKEKGILLPIYSLPSKYGIGDFGYEAYEFIDLLNENGITYWEILPINACNSLPYSPLSYYALEEDYISLDKLHKIGLIRAPNPRKDTDRAKFDDYKETYYKEAYANFKRNKEYYEFSKIEQINQYAEYMNIVSGKSKEYYMFLQYILYTQWMELKKYANLKNIKIIGDMPVYPVFNSAETMFNSECFEMKDGEFTYEAGTPPDYFNVDGQKWNSPVYNVQNIKRNKYKYFVDRYKYYLKLFDKIRVDYFRGYDSFFKIPIGKTGRDGFYVDGVSYGFFDELFKDKGINKEDLIIEDLGDIREDTVRLREHYGFTRQKILQFTLNLENLFDTDNDEENVLAFPANHDCSTMRGWYNNLDEWKKERFKEFLRKNKCSGADISLGIMQYCIKCKAKIVIMTVQDILGLDDSARINLPGVNRPENWSWKLTDFTDLKYKLKFWK